MGLCPQRQKGAIVNELIIAVLLLALLVAAGYALLATRRPSVPHERSSRHVVDVAALERLLERNRGNIEPPDKR